MQTLKSSELDENPRERSNPISALMFCFTMPTFFKGRKKTLDESDLYRALKEHKSEPLGNKLCTAWEEEVKKKTSQQKEPSMVSAVLSVFGWQYMVFGLGLFIIEMVRISQPIFLGGLVNYYAKSSDADNETAAYLYAMGVILCSAFNVLFLQPNMLGIMHVGMKIRVAMCSMIYRKALRLSRTALVNTTTGQVVNLISNDVGRLDTSMVHMHFLWLAPIEIIVVTVLMYDTIGVSALFGVGVMIVFVPLQAYLGKMTSVLRLRTALRTDERVRMMNEIINGIQVIKMYAWEKPFGKLIAFARRKEMNAIVKVNYIRGILQSYSMYLTRVSIFASLVGYVLLGMMLTAEKAFVITAFYNILRNTMTGYFPMAVAQFAETMVSMRRIQKFMMHDETGHKAIADGQQKELNTLQSGPLAIVSENGKPVGLSNGKQAEPKANVEVGVTISNVHAKWDASSTEYTLKGVDLELRARKLVAVIGPVGSGKSSMIQTILGELPVESGTVQVDGQVSYASQEPWLFTGSVRQNILFGLPMDKRRYRTVVKKCALERDFDLFPYGDKTIVGERGTSLSGGQKARISLARAVYRQADIYLLDDPLSAVDTHVGRHLFDQCMRGFLGDKIVMLVTHQLQFLEQADLIVIMDHGRVSAVGTYDSMSRSGLDFAKLLTHAEKDEAAEGDGKQALSRQVSKQSRGYGSVSSLSSVASSVAGETPIPVQETREMGKISGDLYPKYLRAGTNMFGIAIIVILFLISQVLASGGDVFLSYWVDKNENSQVQETARAMLQRVRDRLTGEVRINDDIDYLDIYIFAALTASTIVFSIVRMFAFSTLAKRCSVTLHNQMFAGITRASMYFYHTNPSGRILNRFSKDLGQVDEILPTVMVDTLQVFLGLAGIIVVLALVNPWFLLYTAVLSVIFYYIRVFYLNTSRDVKRLEAITRSPIYSHLGASLDGLSTIRAFGAQGVLMSEFDNYQDLHSSGFYMFMSITRAFSYWLDGVCVIYIALITFSFFLFPPENGGDVGLAITQAMGMTGLVQYGMRQSAELENTMTSVERVLEFKDIEPEGELESPPNKKPPKSWPEQGKVVFDDLSMRYFPDPKSECVLKSLNFEIKSCEKVGIVGRTGAGKSSLINALFRLSYNDGSVVIDQRDTNELGLHDLRSKISIIPQEPVLFSGTMRYNLDPFEEYSDAKLWESLEEVKLKSAISELPLGLQSKISEGGSNFSVGQRQLVCLARALLRENKILVMDEATANVDPQTDALIQTTIRSKFRDCTVLTIAHRLHTVMDSDKVLVMDAGRAVEFGSPYELLTQSETKIFHGMVKQTGNTTFEALLKVAQKAHEDNQMLKKDS